MFPSLGPMEMMVVMVVAVLLFGKRLPEVGRSLGKGIVEFKKGIRGIESEFDEAVNAKPAAPKRVESFVAKEEVAADVPKFDPPSAPPVSATEYQPQAYQD